jgi:DNA polymerase-4
MFGKYTTRLRERAAGIDDRPVISDHEEKSISAEDTFGVDIDDPSRLQSELARLADQTCSRLRSRGLVAGCVNVKIRRHDFTTYTRQRRLTPLTNDTRTLMSAAKQLLATWLAKNPGARIRLLGVGVSHLSASDQLDLFPTHESASAPASAAQVGTSALDSTLDAIRRRFGARSLRRAGNLEDPKNRS